MLKEDADELSVQEQMYIHTLDYARLFCGFAIVLGVILFLLLWLMQDMASNNSLFDPPTEALMIILTLFIIIVPLIIWFIITGKKKISDLGQIMNKYTNDVYFLALGLTPHKNDKNIPEDFYKMCISVFPTLKRDNKKSLKKTGKGLEFKKLMLKDDDNSFGVTMLGSTLYQEQEFIIKYFEKTNSNMQEVIARGGKVIMITDDTSTTMNENIRFKFQIPKTNSTLNPFLLTIPIQFLAYHVALLKNCDIDKPRNLAKSVTVE